MDASSVACIDSQYYLITAEYVINTVVQVDAALFCQHNFLLTLKQTRWLINSVIRSFCSLLMKKEVIFECKLWDVKVLPTF